MTDDHEDPRLDPDDEELVRRALASAPDPGPVPDDVAARLDRTLADLARQRSATPRRRRWPAVLAAALVASLVAFGVGTLVRAGTGAGSGAQSTSSGAASAPYAGARTSQPEGGAARGPAAAPVARLHSASFGRDVGRMLAVLDTTRLGHTSGHLDTRTPRGTTPHPTTRPSACLLPRSPAGSQVLRVLLDGRPATLVLGPSRHGIRTAWAYSCDDVSSPVARARVRSR